jgi:ABC-type sugar transport system substrate-binding protein
MKKILKSLSVLLMFSLIITFTACGKANDATQVSNTKKTVKVGFAQLGTTDAWRIAETNSIKEEAKKRGFEIVFTDAQDQTAKQVSDVEDLIAQKVDYILLAPREYEGLTPALQAAKEAKIPVILIDRAAAGKEGEDYVTLIASDFIWEGEQAAEWLAKTKNGKANIVELMGTVGASVAKDRSDGFRKGIEKYPDMKIISAQTADFTRAKAQKVMENIIQAKGKTFDVVYCHGDEMALGAIQALKAAGINPGKDVLVVGVDGEKDSIKAIIAGEMSATITCSPFFGPKAMDTLAKIIKGEKVETKIINPDKVIDKTNAEEYLPSAF